jgi:hypothetical protein
MLYGLINVSIQTERNQTIYDCSVTSDKYLYYRKLESNLTMSFLVNFNDFNDLILDCNQTYNITEYLAIWPKKALIVDENFQFSKIFNKNKMNSVKTLHLSNLNGIDINSKPFIPIENRRTSNQAKILKIFYSTLNIHSNLLPIDEEKCDSANYNTTTNFAQYFFSISFKNVNYPRRWCPLFFKDFDLAQLVLDDITNSFLIKNRLNFFDIKNTSNVYLKYLIGLTLSITYERLDSKVLSSSLFKKIAFFDLKGIINGIETGLFSSFQHLKLLNLEISNLRELFHMGNKWMNYLNLNVIMSNKKEIDIKKTLRMSLVRHSKTVSFDSIYEYPDEDLCLFKEFPHKRLVYPIIVAGKRLECTCTLYWLQSNINYFDYDISVTFEYDVNYENGIFTKTVFVFCNELFNSSECNLEQRFGMCHILEYNETHTFSFQSDMDIFYMIKFLEFILLVILGPIFCFVGVIHNVLTILVIRNKSRKKEFQESMYGYIKVNAVFNILYCFIMGLKLMNTCIFYGPSVFCSNVYQEDWAQMLKIILVHFLGNVIKMCSNFSYLIFSLSRLLLLTKHKKGEVGGSGGGSFGQIKLSKKSKNVKILFLSIILFSFILSSFKLFQYKINYDFDSRKEFPIEIRDEFYCESESNKFQCKLFNLFKIVNRALNDVLFVILNVCIDLILVRKFKLHMNRKLRQINDVAQHKIIEKSKKSINRMILFNSFIYTFSHLPEFTMTILLIVYTQEITNFCVIKFSCDLLNEEAEFFCLISIVCQFYVFKIFDKNFKKSFDDIKSNLFFCKEKKKESLELRNLNNLIGNGIID